MCYHLIVSAKHRKTLQAIFTAPVPANIVWADVESLFQALGASVESRGGSRVAVELNGQDAHFHRPHPEKETDRNAVRSIRDFLEQAGVQP